MFGQKSIVLFICVTNCTYHIALMIMILYNLKRMIRAINCPYNLLAIVKKYVRRNKIQGEKRYELFIRPVRDQTYDFRE